MMKLPSGRLLQYHKNVASQAPGVNESVIKWMVDEAGRKNVGAAGKVGGLILDEMAIQVIYVDRQTLNGTLWVNFMTKRVDFLQVNI